MLAYGWFGCSQDANYLTKIWGSHGCNIFRILRTIYSLITWLRHKLLICIIVNELYFFFFSFVSMDIVRLIIVILLIFHVCQGAANRKVAATNMNRASSRSHSVFTCIIESKVSALFLALHPPLPLSFPVHFSFPHPEKDEKDKRKSETFSDQHFF